MNKEQMRKMANMMSSNIKAAEKDPKKIREFHKKLDERLTESNESRRIKEVIGMERRFR